MTVVHRIWRWSYELKDFCKYRETRKVGSQVGSNLFHSITIDKKKELLKNFVLYWEEEYYSYCISCSVWCISYRNDIKKILRMFTFENFVKKTDFPEPTTKLKRINCSSNELSVCISIVPELSEVR